MLEIISVILSATAIFAAIMLNLAVRPHLSRKMIAFAATFTVVGGLLMYSYGYACTSNSLPLAVVRAIVAVCTIFAGGNAYPDICMAPAFENNLFHILFWLLHLMGIFSTAGAAIIALGSRLLQRLRVWLIRKKGVAIIFGLNSQTISFGRLLQEEWPVSLVYVGDGTDFGMSDSLDHLDAVLRTDSDALNAGKRFLKSLGLRPGGRKIYLYALSEDMVSDHQYAMALLKTLEQMKIRTEQTALTIRGTEDETDNRFLARDSRYGYGSVVCVDEAELAARLLVQNCAPCETLCFDDGGCACQDFYALIIGFGKVGQAVLRQLIMNGQFQGSTFRAVVFDPACDQIMGRLSCECTELLKHYDLQFYNQDGRSRELYNYLCSNGERLRYVAICTGNDVLNDEIAWELRHFLGRQGYDIPVSCCSHRGITQKRGDDQVTRLALYTPQLLCAHHIDQIAMVVNHTYCGGGTPQENWKKCDYFSRMSSRAFADFADSILYCAGVTREDALKRWEPKGELLENLAKTEHLRWMAFHHCMGFRVMTEAEFEDRVRTYLEEVARTGSSQMRISKDLQKRTHACLVPWDALDLLSAREKAATGREVDYKEMDRNNVRIVADILRKIERQN